MTADSNEINLLKKYLSSTSKHREVPGSKLARGWEKYHEGSTATGSYHSHEPLCLGDSHPLLEVVSILC